MSRISQAGFSLIEVMLVMAITGLMLAAVFAGQESLRSQANFDADIDKVVASVAYARDEAISGVNLDGVGNGTNACSGGSGQTYFAGTVWQADNSVSNVFQLWFYKADPGIGGTGGAACAFAGPQVITMPLNDITVASSDPSSKGIVFARTENGGLVVCSVSNANQQSAQVVQTFENGYCAGGAAQIGAQSSVSFTFKDDASHQSTVNINSSGLATRVN